MINWDNINTVLLDMDGTLLDLHFDNYFWLEHLPQAYAKQHGIPLEKAQTELDRHMVEIQGTLNWYCLDYWTELTKTDIPALKKEIDHKVAFRPHAEDFLQGLRNAGKRSVIITNAHRDSLDVKLPKTNLDTLVDRIISSHDFQAPKEEQAFWEALHDAEPFDPATTLFIDDSLSVLESASRYGIGHLLCIYQPDSQKPKRDIDAYPAIDHFDEIMPKTVVEDSNR